MGIWGTHEHQPYWTTFLCHPSPRLRAIRGLDAKPGLGRFSPAGPDRPCPPALLPILAAARGPLDLLSDGAVGASGGQLQSASGNNFFSSALGVCEILYPVSLLHFSASGALPPLSPQPALRVHTRVYVKDRGGSVLMALSLTSVSLSPLLLTWEQPRSAGDASQAGPPDCPPRTQAPPQCLEGPKVAQTSSRLLQA